MTKNLDLNGFQSIADNYDLFYIDLWGVIHNGIKLHESAVKVLNNLIKMNKNFVLLTNAPRPNKTVQNFLEKMGMDQHLRDHVFTSGEAALIFLNKKYKNKKFFHIGPPRDFDLFLKFKKNYTKNLNDADFILCTGFLDNHEDSLEYYKNLLKKYTKLKMVCTNPDLIVYRGSKQEYCAGTLAVLFKELGGTVIYFGKPYPEIYNFCIKKNERVLVIGDNIRTDIKGANNMKFDSLFITNGIHKKEFKNSLC